MQFQVQKTITPNITNIPTGIKIYIEDKEDESFTLLENSSSFRTTISSDMKGIGRFYIHTTSGVLGTGDILLNNKLSAHNFITIEGLANQGSLTHLKLYDILGKQVVSATLDDQTNTQRVSTEGISIGIYIITLKSGNTLLTKKIIIK